MQSSTFVSAICKVSLIARENIIPSSKPKIYLTHDEITKKKKVPHATNIALGDEYKSEINERAINEKN